jgi:hypothetical protein
VGLLDKMFKGFENPAAYKQAPLGPNENVDTTAYGARVVGGQPVMGARLGLSDQGLQINPVDTDNVRRLAVTLATLSHVHGAGLANKAIEATGYTEPHTIPLSQIQSVEPTRQASLFRPPQARVTLQDGSHLDFGFVAKPSSLNISRKNVQARDSWIDALNRRLG